MACEEERMSSCRLVLTRSRKSPMICQMMIVTQIMATESRAMMRMTNSLEVRPQGTALLSIKVFPDLRLETIASLADLILLAWTVTFVRKGEQISHDIGLNSDHEIKWTRREKTLLYLT